MLRPMSPSMSHSLEKKLDKQPEADLQIQPSDEIKTAKRKRTNSVGQLEMPAYESNQVEETVNEEDSMPPSMNHSLEKKLDKQPEADLQVQPSDEIKTAKRKRTNSVGQLEMPAYESNQVEETVNEEDSNALADDEAEEAGPSDTSRRKGGDPKAVQDYRIIEGKWTSLVDRRWSEKLAELEHEKELIREETHYGYTSGMEEIERRKQQRLSVAHSRKKHHKISSQEQLNSTCHRAYCEFVSGKACWRKEKLSEINSRRWRLKEDKKYLDDFARIAVYSLPDRDQIVQSKHSRQINAFELTDVQEQYGFPAAPWIEQMPQSELEYDLSQIGIGLEDEASEGDTPSSSSPLLNPISVLISADDGNDTSSSNNININNSQYSSQMDIISIEGDQFWLLGKRFKKGDAVLINSSVGQYAARFIMGNKHEVVIQRMDGSKTRLSTTQLRDGRCQMQLKDS